MRPVRSLVIFAALVFPGGGLLAPWLFWLAFAVLTLLLMFFCPRFFRKDGHSNYGSICY